MYNKALSPKVSSKFSKYSRPRREMFFLFSVQARAKRKSSRFSLPQRLTSTNFFSASRIKRRVSFGKRSGTSCSSFVTVLKRGWIVLLISRLKPLCL